MYCAPGKKGNNGTCFDDKSIITMALAYNKKHKHPIKLAGLKPLEIYKKLEAKMSKRCNSEVCWLKQEFAKDLPKDIHEGTFRPEHPKGNNALLFTSDIRAAMKYYHRVYPDFRFIGPVPMDFDMIFDQLAKINPPALLKQGIKKIGIVFNTDPSDKGGEHWIAMFVNLSSRHIHFFDSYGLPPTPEINVLIKRICGFATQMYGPGKKFEIKYNIYRHQLGQTECSVYAMRFILDELKGKSFAEISREMIRDEERSRDRMLFFRPHGM